MEPGTPTYYGVEPRSRDYTALDLFAGAGGLSLGLEWSGFEAVGAVENDPDAADTYDRNFDAAVERGQDGAPLPVEDVDYEAYAGTIDLLAGGPPCQGFSQLGKRLEEDPRNHLWWEFMRAVEQVRPKAFLMENVPPILKSEEGHATVSRGEELGYDMTYGVLSAERFGVPQKRKRAFILGVAGGGRIGLPQPRPEAQRTVGWALRGLPREPTGRDWHVGRNPTAVSLERYACIPEGGNRFDLMKARPDITPRCWMEKPVGSTDVFGRLSRDRPALTIRTEFYKPEKGRFLHPSENRPITHREAARLQTFPDNFKFCGGKVSVARQIGNAVPPLLAYRLGTEIRRAWGHSADAPDPRAAEQLSFTETAGSG